MSKQIDIPRTGKFGRMHGGLYASIPRHLRDAYNLAWRDEFEWVRAPGHGDRGFRLMATTISS